MTNEMTLTNGNAVALFGARDDIREMADRLMKMMPGTTNLTQGEALTVAQIAVAHGLDPFNGEVWGIKGENGKWYGVMVGIKGLRKKARHEAAENNSTFWTEFRLVKPETYDAPPKAIVYECILRDTASVQAYGKSINMLTTAGMPYQEAIKVLGPAPQFVGIGIATPDERSKMGIHQRARKRAEADAIKQAYDVNFSGAKNFGDELPEDAQAVGIADDDDVIEGEVKERRSVEENLTALGFEPEAQDDPDADWRTTFDAWKELGANDEKATAMADKGQMP